MLTSIVREARKSNRAYGKSELLHLLQQRAETEIAQVAQDDRFTFRVASCATLPKSMTQTTEVMPGRKESRPNKTTVREQPRKQLVKVNRAHSPLLTTKSPLSAKPYAPNLSVANLDDSSGATPSVMTAKNPPFTYMGKPLKQSKVHKKQISLLSLTKTGLAADRKISASQTLFENRAYSTIDPTAFVINQSSTLQEASRGKQRSRQLNQ